jgi:hypothetical protein
MGAYSIMNPYIGGGKFLWFQLWQFDNRNPMKIGFLSKEVDKIIEFRMNLIFISENERTPSIVVPYGTIHDYTAIPSTRPLTDHTPPHPPGQSNWPQ